MSLTIVPRTDSDEDEIRRFNSRLLQVQSDFTFPIRASELMPVGPPGCPVWHELYLAKMQGVVRGGYALKHERIFTKGGPRQISNLQIPLSEALVDKAFSNVGVVLLRDALQRAPSLYCLGMGNKDRPLPRLLERMRWKVDYVPFLFRVIRPGRFLSEIRYLRGRRGFDLAASILVRTGVANVVGACWGALGVLKRPSLPATWSFEEVSQFGDDVTRLFESRSLNDFPVLCDRTAEALNFKFPAHDERLIRLVVRDAGILIGWIVMTRTQLKDHRQFGDMKLGSVVDGFCAAENASRIARVAVDRLVQEKVDLIVSNQLHRVWVDALKQNLFVSGPSNFVLGVSPELVAGLPDRDLWHFNRGDGDGPINL